MATRKTRKKKQTKAKKVTHKKKAPKKLAKNKKRPAAKRKSAKKKASPKRAAAKSRARKRPVQRTARARKRPRPVGRNVDDMVASSREGLKARSGGQSGDLQGLSNLSGADSESVDELLEEGNAFEADVVKGVEEADNEGEVHTHEVPEDDVPEEYLDQD